MVGLVPECKHVREIGDLALYVCTCERDFEFLAGVAVCAAILAAIGAFARAGLGTVTRT